MPAVVELAAQAVSVKSRPNLLGKLHGALLLVVGVASFGAGARLGFQGFTVMAAYIGLIMVVCGLTIFWSERRFLFVIAALVGGVCLLLALSGAGMLFVIWAASWAK